MMASRGMGAMNPKKIQRKDAHVPVKVYCEGGMTKGGKVRKVKK